MADVDFTVKLIDRISGPLIGEGHDFAGTAEHFERFSESLATAWAVGMEQLTESGETIQWC